MSNYVYPRFSQKDYNLFRVEGLGLGNLLFIYADALVFAEESGYKMIWPTWPCFTWGNWKAWLIGKSRDRRTYAGLFANRGCYISGIRKIVLRSRYEGIPYREYLANPQTDHKIIEFNEFTSHSFAAIRTKADLVRKNIMEHLKKDITGEIPADMSYAIAAHVRIGDFVAATEEELKKGCRNVRTPVSWFADRIKEIREITGIPVKVYLFSDGKEEELEDILKLPNVERLSLGSSISDILALSHAKLMLASGSTFSMWARYLGRVSTITYEGQMTERLFDDSESAFEIEIAHEANAEQRACIRNLFARKAGE